jgi:outer membrane lipopolysaccharide assembly protein LptE/RlpB
MLLLACLAVFGCGYRLGALNNRDHRTVAVPIFQNKSIVPQIHAQITSAVVKRLQTDASPRVVAESEADMVLSGEVLEVERTPLRFQRLNQSVAREYRLTVAALISLRDRRTGKMIFENLRITGQTDFFIGGDLQSAEAQALALAAENLARKIAARVAEGW